MRHRVGSRKLNRTTSHRLAMLGNMVASLIEHEAIRTTLPKAKEARRVVERVITLGKRGGLSNVRLAARTLHDKGLLQKVFGNLRDRYAERPGGYTRIVRLGYRPGERRRPMTPRSQNPRRLRRRRRLPRPERPREPSKRKNPRRSRSTSGTRRAPPAWCVPETFATRIPPRKAWPEQRLRFRRSIAWGPR